MDRWLPQDSPSHAACGSLAILQLYWVASPQSLSIRGNWMVAVHTSDHPLRRTTSVSSLLRTRPSDACGKRQVADDRKGRDGALQRIEENGRFALATAF
jgi:hypothetical protein